MPRSLSPCPLLAALLLAAAFSAGPAGAQEEAGWREELETFRIGVVASHGLGRDADRRASAERAFARALDMPAEILVARDYPTLIRAHAGGRIHYAVYSATAYAAAWRLCECVEPVASPRAADRSTAIRAALIFSDPPPASLDAIVERKIAMGPEDSLAGRRIPLRALAPEGLPLSGMESFLVAADTEEDAEAMFLEGEVDGMFGWLPAGEDKEATHASGTLTRLEEAEPGGADTTVVWRSRMLRFGPHAVRRELADEARERLARFLVGLKERDRDVYELIEPHRSGGFARAAHEDYAVAVDLLEEAAAGEDDR